MDLISKTSRSRKSDFRRNSRPKKALSRTIEHLEPRRLMTEVGASIPAVLAHTSTAATDSVALNKYFTNSTLPGTLVTINTSLGQIQVSLTDAATPLTVANFLNYVNTGAYTNTIFHRSAILKNSTDKPSPKTPADIIQGGGYSITNGGPNHVATNAPVADEYKSALYGNVAGTIAMAKTSSANSATSEFYFNENSNTELDPPTTDSNGVTTSYTVFGIVYRGADVVKAISELPVYNIDSSLTTVPVTGITQAEADKKAPIGGNNLVFVNSATSQPSTTYTVASDNPSLVTPTINSGVLAFSYASGKNGTANITVKATSLDGTSATTVFPVTVPDAAQPTQGPVASAFTSQAIVTGTSGAVHALSASTDSVSPLITSGVRIVTGPSHGTATVDPATGYINYASTAGFIGNDTISYTVTDLAGTTSAPAVLTVDVVPTPVKITIGTASARALTFTQPDGSVGHLTVNGGTAVVSFTDYQVTTTTSNGVITASGAGATIKDITITNFRGQRASLSLGSSSAITLGSVNDSGNMSSISAPNGTLTGNSVLGSLQSLTVAAASGAHLDLGNNGTSPKLNITTATNSSVVATSIGAINSKQWLNTDGGTYTITAGSIKTLAVSGAFAENLQLSGGGYDLINAKVQAPSGTWNIGGSVFNAALTKPTSSWAFSANGLVRQMTVTGSLASTVTAAAFTSLKVIGTTDSAVIQSNATFVKNRKQIGRISITGAATNTVIFSNGDIGAISAASMVGTRIYAGVKLATAQAGGLATAATDLDHNAKIASVVVANGTSSFSNSLISADVLGSLRLGGINTSNNGVVEGVAAHTISSISGTLNDTAKTRLNLGPAQLRASGKSTAAQVLAAYLTAKKITLGDFAVDLY